MVDEYNDTSLDKVVGLADKFLAIIPQALYDDVVKDLNNQERAALTATIYAKLEMNLIRAFRRMEDSKYGPPKRTQGFGSPFKPFNRPATTDE